MYYWRIELKVYIFKRTMNELDELCIFTRVLRSKMRKNYSVETVRSVFERGTYDTYGPLEDVVYIRNHPDDENAVMAYLNLFLTLH